MLYLIITIFLVAIFIYFYTRYSEGLLGNTTCPDMLIQKGTQYLLYNTYNPESSTNPLVFDNLTQYVDYIKEENEKGNKCPVLFVQQVLGAQGDTTYKLRNDPLNPQNVDYKSSSTNSLNTTTTTNTVGTISTETNDLSMPTQQQQQQPQTTLNYKTQDKYKTPYTRQLYMDNLANSIVQNLSMKEVTNIDKLDLTKSILLETQPTCTKTMDDITPLEVNGLTADPMQTNWGGPEFSTQLINKGYYAGNEVIKTTMGSTI